MPPPVPRVTKWTSTGRARARIGWFRRVVLEVEEERRHYTGPFPPDHPNYCGSGGHAEARWRRARASDIAAALMLRPLGERGETGEET